MRNPSAVGTSDFKPAPPERTVIVPSLKEKWGRHFERGTPTGAMTWKNAKQRSKLMFEWRCAVMKKFESSARVLRVAWLIDCLCWKEGYCYATDAYISETQGIELNNLQKALITLEKAGAIIRASSFVRKVAQRKIWPSAKIIPVTVTGQIQQERSRPKKPSASRPQLRLHDATPSGGSRQPSRGSGVATGTPSGGEGVGTNPRPQSRLDPHPGTTHRVSTTAISLHRYADHGTIVPRLWLEPYNPAEDYPEEARMIQISCLASAPVRQNYRVEERRISGSS
jgi:hypothetical protein